MLLHTKTISIYEENIRGSRVFTISFYYYERVNTYSIIKHSRKSVFYITKKLNLLEKDSSQQVLQANKKIKLPIFKNACLKNTK